MTMRYRTKIIIFFLTGLILYFGTVRTAEFISEKYVYKVISYKIRKNIREQWGADLYMGRVNGNIFTHTNLENVYVAGFKGIDKDLRFEADYIKLSYKPAGILFGKFKAEFGKPRIIYKGISYPLEISHHEEITAILFRNKKVNLSLVSAVLAKDFFLDGTAQAQGEIILKNFKPCLFDISIKSYDARLEYPSYLNALGSICLEIKGSTRNPLLSGDIKLTKIYLPPGMEDASFEEIYKSYFNPDSLKDYIINVCIHGEKVSLEGNNFSALVNGSVELKKNIDENPFLLGRIDIVKGTYAACRNTFNINKGEIIFSRENSPSSVEIEAQTKVRRYKIFAKVNGVSNNYHLTLSAKPKLNHSEIMSLLIFGKNTSALSPRENEQLTRADIRNVLINDIFIGKAEAKLAKSVGLDDININLNEALNSAKNSSVEIGKYIVGEKVYGTYSIKAEGEKDALAQQAVGAEIELTDNIILKGKRHWRESWAQPDEDRLDVEFKWKF